MNLARLGKYVPMYLPAQLAVVGIVCITAVNFSSSKFNNWDLRHQGPSSRPSGDLVRLRTMNNYDLHRFCRMYPHSCDYRTPLTIPTPLKIW